MKSVCRLMVLVGLTSSLMGCTKDPMLHRREKTASLEDERVLWFPRPRLPLQPILLPVCVQSFTHVVQLLGSPANVVRAVVLEDGTRIETGGAIAGMIYQAVPYQENYSLFRSQLTISFSTDPFPWFADMWTLGCVYEYMGQPPFTNLQKNGQTLIINASITWGLAPHKGKKISFLVLD